MAFEKFKNILGGSEPEDETNETPDEEFYTSSREEYSEQNGTAGSKMMLLEPRAYSESQQIADYLKGRNAVVAKKSNTRSSKKNRRLFKWNIIRYWRRIRKTRWWRFPMYT